MEKATSKYNSNDLFMDFREGFSVEDNVYKTAQELISDGVPIDSLGSEIAPLASEVIKESIKSAITDFSKYLEGKGSLSSVWADADDIAKIANMLMYMEMGL